MAHKSQTPKRKRLQKQARLNAAKSWMEKYDGKSIISGYAKWFGVDKACAISELKLLGVQIPDDLGKQILKSEKERITLKNKEKASNADDNPFGPDESFAFIAGYTSGGAPYGLMHEEWDRMKNSHNIRYNDNRPLFLPLSLPSGRLCSSLLPLRK